MPSLSARDKNAILTAGVLLMLFAVIQFIYFPLADQKRDLQRIRAAEQDALITMQALSSKFSDMNRTANQNQIHNRPETFTLFSFLDTRAERSGVKQHIDYMKPASQAVDGRPYTLSKVQLKLTSVYLDQCIDFLTRVESSGVHITFLSLEKKGRPRDRLTMVIQAQTLMPAEGATP